MERNSTFLIFFFSLASAQPVAVFPLNQTVQGLERISRGNLATFSRRTVWARDQNHSIQLLGTPDSYIEIPNLPGSHLDTRTSITLLMHVFPAGTRGAIISFQENGLGVQIWQEGMVDGKGILTARFARRDFSQHPEVSKTVLIMNAWNFIGASYDHESGIARLWHEGNEVEKKYIGKKMELATQFSIRIGALADSGRGDCFLGMVADLHIFAESLGRDAVRAVGGIVPQGNFDIHDLNQKRNQGNSNTWTIPGHADKPKTSSWSKQPLLPNQFLILIRAFDSFVK